jgi:hypothetical protein
MTQRLILYVLTCGPFALTLAGWIKLYRTRQSPRAVALVALGAATATAAYAASTCVYYTFRPPSASLPPWQDPQILDFGLLFPLASLGIIFGLISAGKRAAPGWLILVVELASVPLLLLGMMAGYVV